MYPILCKVQYESLHKLLNKKELWKQIGFSVFVNWIIAPFLMVSYLLYLITLFKILRVKNLHSLRYRGHFFQTRAISVLALFSSALVDASPWYALHVPLDKVVGQSYADISSRS